jgi:glutaredoxin
VLTLYQAEWCPFSSAVREILTELGIDFVARQVEPRPEMRDHLREASGQEEIPTLQTEDGRFFQGTREIFGYLRELDGWEHASAHRQRYDEHGEARETRATARLLNHFPVKAND